LAFNPPRNRDAAHIIRGFVYQTDLTILRWLSLNDQDCLHLESGEDIDLIVNHLAGEVSSEERLQEQVKSRKRNLTLRSADAVSTVANAVESLLKNPSAIFRFLFTTNAGIGQERGFPRLAGLKTLEAWGALRDTIEPAERLLIVKGVRRVLGATVRPRKLPSPTWNVFQQWLNSIDNPGLERFIRSFEWSTGNPVSEQLEDTICRYLQDNGFALTFDEAKAVYCRLFLTVFRTLSGDGLKLLTAKDLRNTLAVLCDPGQAAAISELRDWLDSIELRLGVVERGVLENRQEIESLGRRLSEGVSDPSGDDFSFVFDEPLLSPPIDTSELVDRHDAKRTVIEAFKRSQVVVLRGEPGSGKTQLGASIQGSFERNYWENFQGLAPRASGAQLQSILEKIAGPTQERNLESLLRTIAQHPSTLLVIDDFPTLSGRNELGRWLEQIAARCAGSNFHVLCLSEQVASTEIAQLTPHLASGFTECPNLTADDAKALLEKRRAPERIVTGNTIEFLIEHSNAHMSTFVAAIRLLERRNWSLDDDVFKELISNQHTDELQHSTLRRIKASVDEEDTLELLYRCNIPISRFSKDDVKTLSLVEPTITHPLTRLTTLVGPWVQVVTENQYAVSTLAKHLADAELHPETIKRCNLRLAERLMESGKTSIQDAHVAILHFVKADDVEAASSVLVSALTFLQQNHRRKNFQDFGLLSVWWSMEFPAALTTSRKLAICGLQLSMSPWNRAGVHRVLQRVNEFAESEGESPSAGAVVACFHSSLVAAKTDVALACKFAARYLSSVRKRKQESSTSPDRLMLTMAIAAEVKTVADVLAIVKLIAEQPKHQRDEFCHSRKRIQGIWLMFGMTIFHSLSRKGEHSFWREFDEELKLVAEFASAQQLDLVEAVAVQTRLSVAVDFLDERQRGFTEAKDWLHRDERDEHARFVVQSSLAEQMLHAKEPEQSRVLIDGCIPIAGDFFVARHVRMLMLLARMSKDSGAAERNCKEALQLAQQAPTEISEFDHGQAASETAIAVFHHRGAVKAFTYFDDAARIIFDAADDSVCWKELIVAFGYSMNYCMRKAGGHGLNSENGKEPETPTLGHHFRHGPDAVAGYNRNMRFNQHLLLESYAAAVGDFGAARDWAYRTVNVASEMKSPIFDSLAAESTVVWMVLDGEFGEALTTALEVAPNILRFMISQRKGIDWSLDDPFADVCNSRVPTLESEDFAIRLGFLPSVAQLCTRSLTDPHGVKEDSRSLRSACLRANGNELATNAAELMRRGFAKNASGQDIVKYANEQLSDSPPLLRVAYLIASLCDDCGVEEAIECHLAAIPFFVQLYESDLVVLDRIILPFVEIYWQSRFEKQRFNFSAPNLVEIGLEDVQSGSSIERIKATLRAVSAGISSSHLAQHDGWLKG
tara:strand:- start:10991 stop:15193 length:4203 start_codon:yes stop_codon:yes gene_type:complete